MMDRLLLLIRTEPVRFQALVQGFLALLFSFGVHLSVEQMGSLMAFTALALAFWTRQNVTPHPNNPAIPTDEATGARLPSNSGTIRSAGLCLALLLIAGVGLVACHGYAIHPGAVNSFDSVTYDALNDSRAVIDASKIELASGTLPQSMKPALNRLVDAYDLARASWLTWRDASQKGQPADQYLAKLNANIAILTNALASFKKGGK